MNILRFVNSKDIREHLGISVMNLILLRQHG